TVSRSLQHGIKARPVKLSGSLLDQMPANAIAHGANAEAGQLAVVGLGVTIMLAGVDDVQPPPIAQPVRGTFEPALPIGLEYGGGAGRRALRRYVIEQFLPLRDDGLDAVV